jgi:hypothetical protein
VDTSTDPDASIDATVPTASVRCTARSPPDRIRDATTSNGCRASTEAAITYTGAAIEAHVAAGLGPFVVSFGEAGADEPEDSGQVEEMPTRSVLLRISLLRRWHVAS